MFYDLISLLVYILLCINNLLHVNRLYLNQKLIFPGRNEM